jgi:hypothetical protein
MSGTTKAAWPNKVLAQLKKAVSHANFNTQSMQRRLLCRLQCNGIQFAVPLLQPYDIATKPGICCCRAARKH